MKLLWEESELEIRQINGKDVKFLNKEASQRFFDAYRDLLVEKGLANLEGNLFKEQDVLAIMKAFPKIEKAPVVEEPIVEQPVEEKIIEQPVEEQELDEIGKKVASVLAEEVREFIKLNLTESDYNKVVFTVPVLANFITYLFTHINLSEDVNFNTLLIREAVNEVLVNKVNDKTVDYALIMAEQNVRKFDTDCKINFVENILMGSDPYSGLLQLEKLTQNFEVYEEYKKIIYVAACENINNYRPRTIKNILSALEIYSPVLYNKAIINYGIPAALANGIDTNKKNEDLDTRYNQSYLKEINGEIDFSGLEDDESAKGDFSGLADDEFSGLDDDEFSGLDDDEFSGLDNDEFSGLDDDDLEYKDYSLEDEEEEEYTVTRTGKFLTLSKYVLYAVSGLSALATLYYGFINKEHVGAFVASIGTFFTSMVANIKLNHINEKKEDFDNEREMADYVDDDETIYDVEDDFTRTL